MEVGQRDEHNDIGRRYAAAARVVQTPGADLPYKVVFTNEDGETSEHAFVSMQECEAFIRRNTPIPAERSRLYDREAGQA